MTVIISRAGRQGFGELARIGFSLVLLGALVAGCGTDASPRPPQFTDLPPGSDGTAGDVDELFAKADVIVVGEIVESRPGRTVGPEGEPGVQFLQTELQVVEVLGPQNQDLPTKVEVGHTVSIETDFVIGSTDIIDRVGERVLAFLWLKRDQESAGRYFRPLVSDALFVVESGSLAPIIDGGVSDSLGEKDLGYVRTRAGG